MKRIPSDAVLSAARAFLTRRLAAEQSMTYNLELLMKEAAERIVYICYTYNISPQMLSDGNLPLQMQWDLDEVIQWLYETIEDYFSTLAAAADKDNGMIVLPLITGIDHGMTFDERLNDYLGKFREEVLTLIGAGLFLGLTKKVVSNSIGRNLRHPWKNNELAEGIAAPITYGRGRTNSMYTAIAGLTRFGVAKGWMMSRHIEAQLKEAAGFFTFRNSTCPCDMCDSYADTFHAMDEPTPPIHANCVCGTIYVNHLGEPLNF